MRETGARLDEEITLRSDNPKNTTDSSDSKWKRELKGSHKCREVRTCNVLPDSHISFFRIWVARSIVNWITWCFVEITKLLELSNRSKISILLKLKFKGKRSYTIFLKQFSNTRFALFFFFYRSSFGPNDNSRLSIPRNSQEEGTEVTLLEKKKGRREGLLPPGKSVDTIFVNSTQIPFRKFLLRTGLEDGDKKPV